MIEASLSRLVLRVVDAIVGSESTIIFLLGFELTAWRPLRGGFELLFCGLRPQQSLCISIGFSFLSARGLSFPGALCLSFASSALYLSSCIFRRSSYFSVSSRGIFSQIVFAMPEPGRCGLFAARTFLAHQGVLRSSASVLCRRGYRIRQL